MTSPRLLSHFLLSLPASALVAGPLQEARISQVVNEVQVIEPQRGAHTARLQEVIKDDLGVHTGIQSRAELLFQDNTLTRLGAETFFSFKPGTRDINLERGTLLLQVPKNLGGAQIRAASVTASITGTTIMMEHLPGKSLKILVLEGSLRVGVNSHVGETLLLTPGKMVIMNPAAKRIPEPVNVDLRRLMKTSALIDPKTFAGKSKASIAVLPSVGLIEKAITQQQQLVGRRDLAVTNLVIAGKGTEVIVASDESIARLEDGTSDLIKPAKSNAAEAKRPAATSAAELASVTSSPIRSSSQTSPVVDSISPDRAVESASTAKQLQDLLVEIAKTLIAKNDTTEKSSHDPNDGDESHHGAHHAEPQKTPQAPHTPPPVNYTPVPLTLDPTLPVVDPSTATVLYISNLYRKLPLLRAGTDGVLAVAPDAGSRIELRGNLFKIDRNEIAGVNVRGGSAFLTIGLPGGDGGALFLGTAATPAQNTIEINDTIDATTGENALGVPFGGAGGTVQISTIQEVKMHGGTIAVSSSTPGRASATGGTIGVNSATSIKIENSSQIVSLLDAAAPGPGGAIKFIATRGKIEVSDSRVQADRGTVEIGALGSSDGITLNRATIAGDVVKIGALGANGQLLIGGGTISADTTLKLYAGTTNGQVRFTDNTTLGGAGAKLIAGRTVSIDSHRVVTIGGSTPASVFTDHANYTGSGGNGSSSGHFGGAGATTQPFNQTPSF